MLIVITTGSRKLQLTYIINYCIAKSAENIFKNVAKIAVFAYRLAVLDFPHHFGPTICTAPTLLK